MSPTARSLKWLKDQGWLSWVVETYNPHSRTRQDLFGVFDIISVSPTGTKATQVTSASNVSSRVKKVLASPYTKVCLEAGWEIEVHGWYKNKQLPRVVKIEACPD